MPRAGDRVVIANHAEEEIGSTFVSSQVVQLARPDIDGTLTLMFPSGCDYPVANTYVSSALIAGNLAVCASAPFYQKHWDGIWKDEPSGSTIRNHLNLTDFPFALTDAGDCARFDTFSTPILAFGCSGPCNRRRISTRIRVASSSAYMATR